MTISTISSPSFEEVKSYIEKCNILTQGLLEENEEKISLRVDLIFEGDSPLKIIINDTSVPPIEGFSYSGESYFFKEEKNVDFKSLYTIYRASLFFNVLGDSLSLIDEVSRKSEELGSNAQKKYMATLCDTLQKEDQNSLVNITLFQNSVPLFYLKNYYEGKLIIAASPIREITEEDLDIFEAACSSFKG